MIVKRDNNNRLHCENGPAVIYENGYSLYYLNGFMLKADFYYKVIEKKLTKQDILNIQNMEHRNLAIKYTGIKTMIDILEAKCVRSEKYKINRVVESRIEKVEQEDFLYKVERFFSSVKYFLYYKCPSTHREYIKWVTPFVDKLGYDIVGIQALTHGWTKEDYLRITHS